METVLHLCGETSKTTTPNYGKPVPCCRQLRVGQPARAPGPQGSNAPSRSRCCWPTGPPWGELGAAFPVRAAPAGAPAGVAAGPSRRGAVRGEPVAAGPGRGRGGARRGAVQGSRGHTWLSPPKRRSPAAGEGSSSLGPPRAVAGPLRPAVGGWRCQGPLCWLRRGGSRPLRNQPQVRGGPTCLHDEPHRREPPHSAERRQQHPSLGAGHVRRPAESKSGGAGTPRAAGRCRLPSLQLPEPRLPSSSPPVPATSLFAPFPVRS